MSFRDTFAIGITEFNDGEYYACHETLEEIWQEYRGSARRFIQAIIHAAAAFHHLGRGNLRGTASQLGKAIDKLGDYPSSYLGVDVAGFLAGLAAARGRVEEALSRESDAPVDLDAPMISFNPVPGALDPLDEARDES